MKIPIVGATIDERFLNHRLRSTSFAGMAAALVSGGLFLYRYYSRGLWDWDLFAVLATLVAVKLICMGWYLLTD